LKIEPRTKSKEQKDQRAKNKDTGAGKITFKGRIDGLGVHISELCHWVATSSFLTPAFFVLYSLFFAPGSFVLVLGPGSLLQYPASLFRQ
jgi:hypothetical protein